MPKVENVVIAFAPNWAEEDKESWSFFGSWLESQGAIVHKNSKSGLMSIIFFPEIGLKGGATEKPKKMDTVHIVYPFDYKDIQENEEYDFEAWLQDQGAIACGCCVRPGCIFIAFPAITEQPGLV